MCENSAPILVTLTPASYRSQLPLEQRPSWLAWWWQNFGRFRMHDRPKVPMGEKTLGSRSRVGQATLICTRVPPDDPIFCLFLSDDVTSQRDDHNKNNGPLHTEFSTKIDAVFRWDRPPLEEGSSVDLSCLRWYPNWQPVLSCSTGSYGRPRLVFCFDSGGRKGPPDTKTASGRSWRHTLWFFDPTLIRRDCEFCEKMGLFVWKVV
jgi:hypothetical protein